jgi:hypothetical protein
MDPSVGCGLEAERGWCSGCLGARRSAGIDAGSAREAGRRCPASRGARAISGASARSAQEPAAYPVEDHLLSQQRAGGQGPAAAVRTAISSLPLARMDAPRAGWPGSRRLRGHHAVPPVPARVLGVCTYSPGLRSSAGRIFRSERRSDRRPLKSGDRSCFFVDRAYGDNREMRALSQRVRREPLTVKRSLRALHGNVSLCPLRNAGPETVRRRAIEAVGSWNAPPTRAAVAHPAATVDLEVARLVAERGGAAVPGVPCEDGTRRRLPGKRSYNRIGR